jgi:superfamily I DNA/RNA helicase
MNLTPQQVDFLSTAKDTGSIALRARAGTGKTFSLQQWANKSVKSGIATSFSKSTVEELVKKIGSKFPAKTFHALGLQALKSGGKSVKLEKGKMFEIVKSLAAEHEIPFELQAEIRALATMAKVYGIQPDPAGPEGLTSSETSIWEELATSYDLEFSDEILHWSRTAVNASNLAFTKDGIIDFDDMLYCAVIYPHRFSKSPVILADEVQDFNLLQHSMLKRCLLPNGRVIAAGDDRQAIYGFRGALSNSYNELVSTFGMTELPLTVSFRCPAEVIKVAQFYVPDIEAAPSNIQGAVLYPSTLDLRDVPKTVLCRNNAPLMRLALRLLVSGRTVEIAGRDIGQNLIKLTERITKKNLSADEFLDKLAKWKERELTKYPRRKFSINEKALVLTTLARAHKDLDSMRKHLTKLYPDPKSKEYRPADVHLSTIHKAKGREWPSVLFLDSHLIGKHATSEWEQLQEQNLAYVGVTRAQKELTFATSSIIEGLEES